MPEVLSYLVVLAIAVLPVLYGLAQYNGLIALRNHIRESWSGVDTELKRRYELIPNLVATVQAYATHERAVLEKVTSLRDRCAANHGPVARQAADESQLVDELRHLLAVIEAYPDLKADAGFQRVQEELITTENRIQVARRFYNGNVRDYRNKRESFPSSLVASLFGFGPEEFFAVDSATRTAPVVENL